MTKKILIDDDPNVTRMVILHNHHLEHIELEIKNRKSLVRNIYLARIDNFDSSLDAFFVDYGGLRNGMLSRDDVYSPQCLLTIHGDPPTQSTPVDQQETSLPASCVQDLPKEGDLVLPKEGDMVLVQIARDEYGEKKGAKVTMRTSLIGRYYTMNLYQTNANTSPEERFSLTAIGKDADESDKQREQQALLEKEKYIQDMVSRHSNEKVPRLVYEEANVIQRALRDYYTKEIQTVLIQGEQGYRLAKEFIRNFSDVTHVEHYNERIPLFHHEKDSSLKSVEQQVQELLDPTISLPSGGTIVINRTEALTAIDVNSGKTKSTHEESSALKTNIEAAQEISRHIRLRNLGGLFVIDFINMGNNHEYHSQVKNKLKEAMKSDSVEYKIGHFDKKFGLLPLSRQRLGPGVYDYYLKACQYCQGNGNIRPFDAIFYDILWHIEQQAYSKIRELQITLPMQHIMDFLVNHRRQSLSEMEQRLDIKISVKADDTLLPHQFDISPIPKSQHHKFQDYPSPSVVYKGTKKGTKISSYSKSLVSSSHSAPQEERTSSQEERTSLLKRKGGFLKRKRPLLKRKGPLLKRKGRFLKRKCLLRKSVLKNTKPLLHKYSPKREKRLLKKKRRFLKRKGRFLKRKCLLRKSVLKNTKPLLYKRSPKRKRRLLKKKRHFLKRTLFKNKKIPFKRGLFCKPMDATHKRTLVYGGKILLSPMMVAYRDNA